MKITLKDGVVKEFDNAVSVLEIAKSISEGLARNACAGKGFTFCCGQGC